MTMFFGFLFLLMIGLAAICTVVFFKYYGEVKKVYKPIPPKRKKRDSERRRLAKKN